MIDENDLPFLSDINGYGTNCLKDHFEHIEKHKLNKEAYHYIMDLLGSNMHL